MIISKLLPEAVWLYNKNNNTFLKYCIRKVFLILNNFVKIKNIKMKNLKKISLLFVLMTFAVSCACMKDKNTISGKVQSIENGKDGYTAKINTDKNEVYFATVSIVNVGGPQNYKQLKEGEEVVLKGEIWKNDTEKHIKVKEIISVK
jgi:hypothetical protein